MSSLPRVTLIGGGMITQTQLLPSLYQLQREGAIGEIHVLALAARHLLALRSAPALRRAFPSQGFVAWPDPARVDPDEPFPHLYKEVLARAPRGSIAVIATPDPLHYPMIREALERDLHVLTVKPLVLRAAEGEEIARIASERGLFVGIEYHKRFDHRSLMARQAYRAGRLGRFRLGQAQMVEPYYYRESNFQNWCTCENSDMFTYVGCHYVDLVAFITGLRPISVSVYGIRDRYPNGKEGFLWTDARVIWENGASLSVANAIGYPTEAAGSNAQGLTLWCQGDRDATLLVHSDQYRGVKCHYNSAGEEPGDTLYAEPNPDYYQLLYLGGEGLVPAGYGHRSVEAIVKACRAASEISGLEERRRFIRRIDEEGIIATPANSAYNERVIEAGRKSILSGGREVHIDW
ncbi:MAG: Gfo/Idh/MocA family oxidoreductase [Planctomycetota bacterium]